MASKLIATVSDLEKIASDDDADTPALHGWRREAFGEDALRLKRGELALVLDGRGCGWCEVRRAARARRLGALIAGVEALRRARSHGPQLEFAVQQVGQGLRRAWRSVRRAGSAAQAVLGLQDDGAGLEVQARRGRAAPGCGRRGRSPGGWPRPAPGRAGSRSGVSRRAISSRLGHGRRGGVAGEGGARPGTRARRGSCRRSARAAPGRRPGRRGGRGAAARRGRPGGRRRPAAPGRARRTPAPACRTRAPARPRAPGPGPRRRLRGAPSAAQPSTSGSRSRSAGGHGLEQQAFAQAIGRQHHPLDAQPLDQALQHHGGVGQGLRRGACEMPSIRSSERTRLAGR